MFSDKIKELITHSIRNKTPDKDVLRCVLGEIQSSENRQGGKSLPDSEVEKIVRKMIASNNETIKMSLPPGYESGNVALAEKLGQENKILLSLVPKQLTSTEIESFLTSMENKNLQNEIVKAKNDGIATGMASKALKNVGLSFDGAEVSKIVKKMRLI